MTKQEKQLLLIDLCARLPYGVICDMWFERNPEGKITEALKCGGLMRLMNNAFDFVAKPYLRPMSSMTEEEREHLQTLHNIISDENYGDGFSPAALEAILDFNNYCREHHLDNGGLITLGLGLEAPEGMYK